MKKTVEVKKCCWICQHFRLYYEDYRCEKGHKINSVLSVCEDFELWEDIKAEERDRCV